MIYATPLLARPDNVVFDGRMVSMLTSVVGFALAFALGRRFGGVGMSRPLVTASALISAVATGVHLLVGTGLPLWADMVMVAVFSVFFAFLLVGSGEVYVRMEPFQALAFAAGSYVLGWVGSSAVDMLPRMAAGAIVALMPLVAAAMMPCWGRGADEPADVTGDAAGSHGAAGGRGISLAQDMRLTYSALPVRIVVGLFVTHFALGAMMLAVGTASTAASFFSLASIAAAVLTSLVCLGIALALKRRVPLVTFYKVALVVQVLGVFLLVEATGPAQLVTVVSFVGIYIVSWALVAQCGHAGLAIGALPVLVVAAGRLVEQLGEGLGLLLVRTVQLDGLMLGAIVAVLLLVAAAFLFTGSLEGDSAPSSRPRPFVGGGAVEGTNGAAARVGVGGFGGADRADGAEGQLSASGGTGTSSRGVGSASPSPSIEARLAWIARAYRLSARETEVFELWATGHDLKYVQERLGLSLSTVKTHVRHIYAKTDTHSRAEVVILLDEAQPDPEQ